MDLLQKEQKVSLFFQKENNLVEISCTIESLKDDRIELNLPQYFMRYIDFLQVGKTLTVKAFSKFGTIDFNSIVIYSPLEENFTIELDYNSIKLTASGDISKISAIEDLDFYDNELKHYKTFEISADYIKFTSDDKYEIEKEFEGTIRLPKDYGIIKFKAVISEIDAVYDNEYTAKFITMQDDSRQNLLYYMYAYSNNED